MQLVVAFTHDKGMAGSVEPAVAEAIGQKILVIRGQRVLLDSDLAVLYGVATKRFNEAVARNVGRFPDDFMFVLANQDVANLRSQFATSSSGYGGRRYLPRAFTEHGAIMAATILNTPRSIPIRGNDSIRSTKRYLD